MDFLGLRTRRGCSVDFLAKHTVQAEIIRAVPSYICRPAAAHSVGTLKFIQGETSDSLSVQ